MTTTKATPHISPVKITSAAFKANPFPFYRQLRAEAPVYRTPVQVYGSAWLVTRYDDVVALLKDERFIKNRRTVSGKPLPIPFASFFAPLQNGMLDQDNPDHGRLRTLVHKAFTPRMMEGWRTRAQQVADALIDQQQAKGRMDLIHDFADILPITIISEIMGIPGPDQLKFKDWTTAIFAMGANPSPLTMARGVPSVIVMLRYMRRIIQQRRAQPQEDLISVLAQVEEQGDNLSEDELLSMLFLLLSAGHETTINLIGNGMAALFAHPDQLALLRSDPRLSRTAIEELLRFAGPAEQATQRYASEDITLQGVPIKKGELVLGVLASANRDESHFKNPDTLDITRDPNRHLAFGHGIHYCVGVPLARLEGQIAINTLLRRLPNLRLAVPADELRWRSAFVIRGLESLPVLF